MGNKITHTSTDTEKLDPKSLAIELEGSFAKYYTAKKNELQRKKQDLASLKKRADIREDNAPIVSKNVISALYSNLG